MARKILRVFPICSDLSATAPNFLFTSFQSNKSAAEIEAYLVAAVLQVPGVVTINRFDLVEVSAQRRVVVNMDVQVESFDFQGIGTQSEVNISLGVGNDG